MFTIVALATAALIAAALVVVLSRYQLNSLSSHHVKHDESNSDAKKDAYRDIVPLDDFDWRTTEPAKVYKFKPRYHLTMALENLNLSELLAMDKTYLDRVKLRRTIMAENSTATVRCNPPAEHAVRELYHWLITVYLPRRFPTVYTLSTNGTQLHNRATDEDLPITPANSLDALRLLGSHIDTDFLILLPSSTAEDGSPVYHLEAFVTCFPSGFDTSKKLGLPLAAIHGPVPGYASKIGKSMDRFFARLEVGKAAKRSNWTITTDDVLFRLGGTHVYADSATPDTGSVDAEIRRRREQVVPESCRLRSERQTLHRLPRTKALVFAFKTYLYRLDDLRRDPWEAEELAQAIEGLGEGNVPAIKVYKSGIIWGEKVIGYLRGTDVDG